MKYDQKIEALRVKLGEMIESENCDQSDILRVSQELDILISQYYESQ